MLFLKELWFPIIVSAGVVFALSVLLWRVAPHHKGEWRKLPTEHDVLNAMRGATITPGNYELPFTDGQDLGRADLRAALERGPVAYLSVVENGIPNRNGKYAMSMVFHLLIATCVAYVGWHGFTPQVGAATGHLPLGIPVWHVVRVVGAVTFMAYGIGPFRQSIWFGRPWKSFLLGLADALLYGLATGFVFGTLWPQ